MTTHKHLEEVDPSTLNPTELRERLTWRDEHPAEVIRAEREREAQRRLDQAHLLREGRAVKERPVTVAKEAAICELLLAQPRKKKVTNSNK